MIGFFADDFTFIKQFASHQSVLRLLFTNTDGAVGGGSWRPLTSLQFWFTFGLNFSATVQHIISVLLYLLCGYLFFLLLKKDFKILYAGAAAALWLLLPIHTEPLMWIAARADLLAAIFALATLLAAQKNKVWQSVAWFAVSILCKEVWVLLPVAAFFILPAQSRKKYSIASFSVLAVWAIVRWRITSYGVGGYSVGSVPWSARAFFMNEQLIDFIGGIFLWGQSQATVVTWISEFWFIVSYVIWAGAARLIYLWRQHVPQLLLLGATLLPILLLKVPFVSGHASVAEQRYWFAPSIALAWLMAAGLFSLAKKYPRIFGGITISVGFIFACGLITSISYFATAGRYEEQALQRWNVAATSTSTPLIVAFAPDTYAGVHLLASPFFEAAAATQPASVAPWYSQSGPGLPPTWAVWRSEGRVFASSTSPRFISLHRAGIHAELSESITPTSTIAAWNGVDWVVLPPQVPPVDNPPESRY